MLQLQPLRWDGVTLWASDTTVPSAPEEARASVPPDCGASVTLASRSTLPASGPSLAVLPSASAGARGKVR
jgi:hypothetical protein